VTLDSDDSHTIFFFEHQLLTPNMRICILQFGPKVGELDANISRADELLKDVTPDSLDLLVLPELALTGTAPEFYLPLLVHHTLHG
jgi:predicted amidohydrolase